MGSSCQFISLSIRLRCHTIVALLRLSKCCLCSLVDSPESIKTSSVGWWMSGIHTCTGPNRQVPPCGAVLGTCCRSNAVLSATVTHAAGAVVMAAYPLFMLQPLWFQPMVWFEPR